MSQPMSEIDLEILKTEIYVYIADRITVRNLKVMFALTGTKITVILSGRAYSYFLKGRAQELALGYLGSRGINIELANNIEVIG